MDTVKLKVIIESTENNYSAYIENLDGIVATGETIAEIKDHMHSAIRVFMETCREVNCEIPDILKGNYELEFRMDVKSLLNLYTGIFTKSGLERLTGINQKQLWHYAHGISKPREAQVRKIESALHRLGDELLAIQL